MRARLEGHVERRAARAVACGAQRVHLRVRPAVPLVPALADDLAVPHDDRADERIRIGPAASSLGELDGARDRHASACTRRRYARGRSSRPKMLVPATSRLAPERYSSRTFSGPTPPSTWMNTSARQQPAQRAHASDRLGHELLARVARIDAHAEDEVEAVGGARRVLGRRLGIEREADAEALFARERGDRLRIVARLVVKRDARAAGFADRLEVALGILDHQVAVDRALVLEDHRRDRLEHDRPDRDRRDEMAVTDVEVEDARAGAQQGLDLLAEPREVGRVERRLDLDRPHPVTPAHGCASLRPSASQPRDEEAARPVDVRQRQQKLRATRMTELRPLVAERRSISRPGRVDDVLRSRRR